MNVSKAALYSSLQIIVSLYRLLHSCNIISFRFHVLITYEHINFWLLCNRVLLKRPHYCDLQISFRLSHQFQNLKFLKEKILKPIRYSLLNSNPEASQERFDKIFFQTTMNFLVKFISLLISWWKWFILKAKCIVNLSFRWRNQYS